ncbi:MAG: hypothetical protein ACM3OC_02675 [Deltaproteobacteria bacterium]
MRFLIANTVLEIKSRHKADDTCAISFDRYRYYGSRDPDIELEVVLKDDPGRAAKNKIFTCMNPVTGRVSWDLARSGSVYVMEYRDSVFRQIMRVNGDFDRGRIIFSGIGTWRLFDVISNFLEVMIIMRHARAGSGISIHSASARFRGGAGVVFAGRSGAGKTTISGLLDKRRGVQVLNDDRIFVCREGKGYALLACPWHSWSGESGGSEAVPLTRIYLLSHGRKNSLNPVPRSESFRGLYPHVFSPFWDRERMGRVFDFCDELARRVPLFNLEFVNDESILAFIKKEGGFA